MKTRKYNTYLPIFPGFYNTIWDESERFVEYETSDEESFRDHYPELTEVPWERVQSDFWQCVDYRAGNLAVAQAALDALPEILPDFVKGVKFEAMRSPREYNFTNDAVNCAIEIDVDAVLSYLTENAGAFATWLLRRYSSRDGFISFHSTDSADWLDPEGWEGHQAGAILDFIAAEELEDPGLALYYAANTSEAFCNAADVDTSKLLNS